MVTDILYQEELPFPFTYRPRVLLPVVTGTLPPFIQWKGEGDTLSGSPNEILKSEAITLNN